MIVEMIMGIIYRFFDVIVWFELPKLPPEALEYIDLLFSYLAPGAGILANYTPFDYLMTLLTFIVMLEIGLAVYHFVMWIIRKLPWSSE